MLIGMEIAQTGEPQETCKDRVWRIVNNLVEAVPAYKPLERKPGRGDGDWLLCLAQEWEDRARSRLITKIEPREMWNLSRSLHKAGSALDTFEYERFAAPTEEGKT